MSRGERPDPLAMIARMAEGERKLSEVTFMAPITAGGGVRIRVQGVVYELKVSGPQPPNGGWALLRCTAPGVAQVVGEPSLTQITEYLKLLPRVRMVLLEEFNGSWWGVQASAGEKNFNISGAVPLYMVRGGATFDTINSRFDGARFWFESQDRRRDPAIARALRVCAGADANPDDVRVKGMTPPEMVAYKVLWLSRHPEAIEERVVSQNDRIREALEHAGAFLDAFWNEDNTTVVRFLLDGQTHVVTVRSDDLTVYSSGICLSGRDSDFDLSSLVGVLREHDYY